jgi:hypothetical protein
LNGQIVNSGVIPCAVVDVEFTVVASIGSDATKNVTSAPITVKVTTLAGMSEALHLCGDMFDDASGFGTNNYWNINNYQYVMFRDDNMSLDFYISNFPEGAELKFIPNSTLGDWTKPSYGKDGSNDGVLKGKDAGNIKLTGLTGYTKITADLLNLTYTIEPYDASGATVHPKMCISGDFNGWTNQEMTQSHYDPHIWFIDGVVLEDVGKGVKFHTGDWTTNWGTVDFPYGKGVQNGANIEVTETGTYFVKICDLTGNYVFYKTN